MDVRRGKLEQGEERMEIVTAMEEFFERNCCTRGYHVYKEVWGAAVDESLVCERESENASDRYAVAVKKGTIIGHLARKVSRVCSLFLRRGRTIECTVTGNWAQEIFS